MQNLFALLKRYSNFLYFIVLQSVCFFLLVNNNNFHGSKFWNSSNEVAGWIQETQSNVAAYLNLRSENDKLSKENSRLKDIVFGRVNPTKGDWLKKIDSLSKLKYEYLPARVIASSSKFEKNYLTLDIGTSDGVDPDQLMGVIGPQGVVGYAKKGGSTNYTRVVSVLHSKFILSVVHKGSGQQGILTWESEDDRYTASIVEFPNYVDVKAGDEIITSGNTGVFPRGEMVGAVSEVITVPKTNLSSLKVKLATDFNSVYHVSVIRNNEIIEVREFEEGADQDIKPTP